MALVHIYVNNKFKMEFKMCETNYSVRSAFNYDDKPETIEHLKANSRDVISELRPQTVKKVHENWSD